MIDGFVVDVAWADIQPQPFAPLVADNAIDRAITSVRSLAGGAGGDMRIKLRVNAGVDAPEGAKHLGGEPVAVDYEGYRAWRGRWAGSGRPSSAPPTTTCRSGWPRPTTWCPKWLRWRSPGA